MALQTSGAISLNDIHVEAGGSSGSQASINDTDIRGLIGKSSGAQMSFSEWYGAANEVTLSSAGTINGQAQQKEITASSFIGAGGTLIIPSSLWVWSDSISTAALTIDVSCTVKVYGKVIGRGGNGILESNGQNGGPAIKINSGVTGVSITNYSGGYIAGGGGGGGGNANGSGGGGGAGGGSGGNGDRTNGGAGGSLNASGSDGGFESGYGGGAGGGGGANFTSGGGGGRILPGSGGSGAVAGPMIGGNGGSAGNAGSTPTGYPTSGGGGGWGASGGNDGSNSQSGGTGGKAIDDSGVSYSLSNSGTIYGGT